MANTQTNRNLGESFVLNLLDVPNKFDQAYKSYEAEGYNLFNQMIFQMNLPFGGSQKTDQVKFQRATLGGVEVYATVSQAPSLSGTNLVVTVPAANNKFRVSEIVADNNMIQGRVVSKTATTITLSPISVSAWNASTHFQAGNIANVVGQASISKFSTGLDSLYNVPEYDYNFTQIQRESVGMARRDKIETYTVSNGAPFWSNAQVDQTLMRFLRKKELTFYWGERTITGSATNDPNDPDAITTTGGIRWNVMQDGMYIAMPSEITFNTWIEYLSEFKRRNPTTSKVVGICGQDFLRGIQTGVTNDYILQAGDKNTFGGLAVKGIDVRKFNYLGLEVELALWTGYDAPDMAGKISTITNRPRYSHSCLLFPTTPIGNASGGPALPAIVPYHFGEQQYLGGFRKGIYDGGTSMSRADLGAAMADLTLNGMVTDLDAMNFEIYCDWGLWVQAERMMLLELAS